MQEPILLPYANISAANQHKLNFINQRNEPHQFQSCWPNTREMVTFEKPENKRQMYGSQAWVDNGLLLSYIDLSLIFGVFKCLPFHLSVWPTALKLGSITNFDILFLVMGFISLVDEI